MNKAHGLITDLLADLNIDVFGFGTDDGTYDPVVSLLRSIRFKTGRASFSTDTSEVDAPDYRRVLESALEKHLEERTCCLADDISGTDTFDLLVDLCAILMSVVLTDSTELLNDRVQIPLPF
jgi:hypothetical protein